MSESNDLLNNLSISIQTQLQSSPPRAKRVRDEVHDARECPTGGGLDAARWGPGARPRLHAHAGKGEGVAGLDLAIVAIWDLETSGEGIGKLMKL